MKIKQIIIIITLLFFSFKYIYGQNQKLDSLWAEYNKAMHDTSRINLLNEEIGLIYRNINQDSALICYKKAITIANNADPTQTDSTFSLLKSNSIIYIGIIYHYKGAYDKAVEYYIQALEIRENLGNKAGIAKCYNNIGVVHWRQRNYDKAIEYYNQALKIYKELDDKIGISGSYNNIGVIHNNMKNYNKSVEYFLKALKIHKEMNDKKGISRCYLNIGFANHKQGNYNTAKEYYQKSLKIDEESCDKYGMAIVFNNIASTHTALYDSATYLGIKARTACLDSAIIYSDKAYNLAVEIGYVRIQNEVASNLQKAYTKLGRYKKAIKYAEIFITTKDSMFSEEKTKALAEMETKYESEKNQLMIEKMEKQKESDNKTILAQQAENKKQQIIIISIIGGLIMVLVFLIILLRMYRQKQKANYLLAVQNIEINKQKDEIQTQMDFAEKQKEFIEQQNKELEKHRNQLEQLVRERTADLLTAKEKAEESDRLKSAFLANMSHEIRTPMNAIIGFSGLLNNKVLDEKRKTELISYIIRSSDTLLHLINNIIDISKIEAGQLEIFKDNCYINKIFDELIDIYKEKKKLELNKNVELKFFKKEDEDIVLYTDSIRLQQVLINLINNALKFTEKGFIEIGYNIKDSSKKQSVVFRVKDSGIGLTEEQQNKIFSRFTKLENERKKLYRGAGLGLSICKNIVELLGGKIWIDSEVNKGSTFYFSIPCLKDL